MNTYNDENRLMRNTLSLIETMLDNHQFQNLNTKDKEVINSIKETLNITLSIINK